MYTKPKKNPKRASLVSFLQSAGIRSTRQRLDMAELLFDGSHKHVTAETVRGLLRRQRASVSLATIYNGLHDFVRAGLLSEVGIGKGCVYFDTNLDPHHHFWDEASEHLIDIPASAVKFSRLPSAPEGWRFAGVNLILHLRREKGASPGPSGRMKGQ